MKNKYTPEIRFSEFARDWEQRKLDSIVDRVKSYSLSRDVETSEHTGYKYIHYGDIHTKVADVIDESSCLPNIKAGNYELLEKGDLVLADASEDYQGIATPAVITIDTTYKLVSGLHTIALRPKQVDSLFLYYLINSPTFRKYGYKTGTGMKVFGISVTNLLKFEGMFPLLEEQTKIGDFLKKLDGTITLHQQELAFRKKTKQGFLQKMFPKEGESVPEVRFPGFPGDWKQCMFKDFTKLSQGLQIAIDKRYTEPGDNKLFYITNEFLNPNSDKKYFIEEPPKSVIAKKDDILMTRTGNTGKVVTDVEGAFHNNFFKIAYAEKETSKLFLYYLLTSFSVQKEIIARAGTSTIPDLNHNDFYKIKVTLPSKSEQIKIGNFFKQLDDTIALHQRELDALKETKTAFLQKMFV